MSDLSEADKPQPVEQTEADPSPPRLSPSPDAIEPGLKPSRKREREISVEPATTPSASNDPDTLIRQRKDSSSPLKKNRRHLDSTAEEEEAMGSRSGSGSPPTTSVLVSPRQEMKRKVRQISRGVEDINWKNLNNLNSSNKDTGVDIEPTILEHPHSDEDVELNQETTHTMENIDGDDKKTDVDVNVPSLEPPIDLDGDSHMKKEKTEEVAADNLTAPSTAANENVALVSEDQEQDVNDKNIADDRVNDGRSTPKTPEEESALSQSVPNIRALDSTMAVDSLSPARLRAGSDSNDKSLKRKFLERGTSQGPPEQGDDAQRSQEPLKRPRDDDKDENPRETKRLTPPPSPPRPTPPSPKLTKQTGFLSYASTSSPFSTVKGRNVFASAKTSFSSPSNSASPIPSSLSTPAPESKSVFGESSSDSAPAAVKRSGFEAFASSSSPFATANRGSTPVLGTTSRLGRAKSPPRTSSMFSSNPFASYAGSAQAFAVPVQKRARAGSPDGSGQSSLERATSTSVFGETGKGSDSGEEDEQEEGAMTFGEKLRAGKDDEDERWDEDSRVQLTEQDVLTGEEEEDTVHQVRGKLFSLDGASWKERGTGLLKLNVKASDGTRARLVMRKDAVYTLLLNITLFPGMRCSVAQDPRYVRISSIENGEAKTYNIRVANSKIASELIEEINAYIPT